MSQLDLQKFSEQVLRTYKDGELIFSEHENGREMFIIQSGAVKIFKMVEQKEVVLATIERGGFIGEMSLLESLPRSASARAVGETKLVILNPGGFLLKIRRDPTFAYELMQQLSRRIRSTNERLLDLIKHDDTSHASVKEVILKSAQ